MAEEKGLAALKTLLGLILAVGNYMNGGTPRGQAHGFRLEMANKLDTIKPVVLTSSTGGQKGTLLHYIARVAQKRAPNEVGNLRTVDIYASCFFIESLTQSKK